MMRIQTAKLNEVDPMAWLTDVLERSVSGRTKAHELHMCKAVTNQSLGWLSLAGRGRLRRSFDMNTVTTGAPGAHYLATPFNLIAAVAG